MTSVVSSQQTHYHLIRPTIRISHNCRFGRLIERRLFGLRDWEPPTTTAPAQQPERDPDNVNQREMSHVFLWADLNTMCCCGENFLEKRFKRIKYATQIL